MNSTTVRTVPTDARGPRSWQLCRIIDSVFPSRYGDPMTRRILWPAAILGAMATSAVAAPASKQPAVVAVLPAVGDSLPLAGHVTWPVREWLYDVPSEKDAAGKIVIHWFCTQKVKMCVDDLARIVTLKENARVYVIAYISGLKGDAKKLDPIRESEGVGRGTVAFGKGVQAM